MSVPRTLPDVLQVFFFRWRSVLQNRFHAAVVHFFHEFLQQDDAFQHFVQFVRLRVKVSFKVNRRHSDIKSGHLYRADLFSCFQKDTV